MKAGLVVRLIEAHCSGQESLFEKALLELADDEERKGNIALAQTLRNAYRPNINKQNTDICTENAVSSSRFVAQGSLLKLAPRDRESNLELYEIIYPNIKLNDVILPVEQKEILMQIIREQKNAALLQEQGLQPINRLLLCGPPGCGKTMTAMALANELGLPMAYVRLDGLISSFLGQTGTNLRKVFDSIKNLRVVLFLDEFDAIAKKRDDAHELGELKRVVTTLLQNFDNMSDSIFLIAATNHQHLLDPAIWRRFNMVIMLELPDIDQRKLLLKRMLDKYPISSDLDIDLVAKVCEGMNCSQIKEIVSTTAKNLFVNYPGSTISTEDILKIIIKHVTLYSEKNSKEFWINIRQLRQRGVSLRVLERVLGIPKSTINDKIKGRWINEQK
ncbi:ATP-binding protein [Desulfofundulus sp. TPOSR]|uniref:AAA family ATPase n=1 Tax=Desulfofundulus sp. TPOSR TaxID=2714340 RepID=UPI001407D8EF|nr:ATP-binding protein [Desulfofundulus sp. TPOSR]NHM28151.1 ATP-binding protein [Desulfofundulus sp. TPOSR]